MASLAQYNATLGKAKQGYGQIQYTANWLTKVLEVEYCSDAALSAVVPYVHLPRINLLCVVVKYNINEFQASLNEYLPMLFEALACMEMVPIFMWDAGNQWKSIQSTAAQVGNSVGWLSKSEYMGWWEGYGGEVYAKGVGDQPGAVTAISDTAGAVCGACDSFCITALEALVNIANGIASLIEEFRTAVPTLGTRAVLAARQAVTSFGDAMAELKQGIDAAERQLQRALPIQGMYGGSSGPEGDWPSATQGWS